MRTQAYFGKSRKNILKLFMLQGHQVGVCKYAKDLNSRHDKVKYGPTGAAHSYYLTGFLHSRNRFFSILTTNH
jgi:hypothetical protein